MNPGDRVTQAEIQAELIGTLFRSIPVAIAVHVVSSTVLVSMLWDKAARDRLLLWLAALYGLAAVRWLLLRAYQRRRPTVEGIPPWGRAAAALSWTFGLAWGAVPVLFLDPAQPLNL
ncbi:MAG TPA: hypothetical protein PK880_08445, partial [Candidatus Competibacter sp.]|nr:hypothetical protein [Candidatus Competibacter sp.]